MQRVLLSVIMVGRGVQAAAADKRAEGHFHDTSATLDEMAHVHGRLAAQGELLTKIAAKIGRAATGCLRVNREPLRWLPTGEA